MHHLIKLPFLLFVLLIVLAIIWKGGPDEQLGGIVWMHETHVPVDSAYVMLLSPDDSPLDSAVTDSVGKFQFTTQEFKECKLTIRKPGFHTRTVDLSAAMNSNPASLVRIEIHPTAAPVTPQAGGNTIFNQ